MDCRRAGIITVTVSGVLLLPGVAFAQSEGIPPIPLSGRHPDACVAVKGTYRVTVASARTAKRAAHAAARTAWLAGTADERQQLAVALAAADRKREVKQAKRVYRKATADERAVRAEQRRNARDEYRATVKQARKTFRKGWRTCH